MAVPNLRFKREDGSEYPEWTAAAIEDITEKQSLPVKVNPKEEYREIGIRSHGKGLFYKEPVLGKELGNKRVFEIVPDCLIVNIVFAWERAVARTTENEIGMIASHRFPMYKPKEDILDLDYMVRYLITDRGKLLLELASPGGAGRNRTLGQKEFAKSRLPLPCIEEQLKIVAFLVELDNMISACQDEVKNLEQQKKAIMQKIFSQEIRFKRKDGTEFPEWEEKQLVELLDYEQPTKYIVQSTKYDNHYKTPVLTAGQSFILGYTDEINGIYIADSNKPVIIFDDFTTSFHWVDFQFKVKSSAMKILTPNSKDICFYYIFTAMQTISYIPKEHSRQWISRYSQFTIPYPCLEEQQKIADFLSEYDTAIQAAREELEKWQELKKGLLQQMFV